VGVVEKLISEDMRDDFISQNEELQSELVASYQGRQQKLVPYSVAQEKRFQTDWDSVQIDKPSFVGTKVLDDIPLSTLREYIDWSPYFMTWELKGKYPKIFQDAVVGEQAKIVYDEANELLDELIRSGRVRAKAAYGFWPAASDGDDVILYTDESRQEEKTRFHFLRQQWERRGQTDFRSLADYIAPKDSKREDYLGGFVVTAGIGADEYVRELQDKLEDGKAITLQAVTDRCAEAFAEYLHEQARRDWGFGLNEQLSNEDLIGEKYRGIRPAAGYPACPDHTEKETLFDLLSAQENTTVELTSSFAMTPAASVSGLYFGHPNARYFTVDRITKDQVESYAKRKGRPIQEIEKWLAPNLAYEPS